MLEQLSNANLAPPPGGLGGNQGINPMPSGETQSEIYPGKQNAPLAKRAFRGISETNGNYELNFSDAELSELAKVVFRDTLNTPYVFNERVQGRVTVSTGGPVSRNELLSILEAVLEVNRAALLSDGRIYRVVPDSEKKAHAVSVFDYARERGETGPGYGVTILPLRYVSSDTMMRMLESVTTNQEAVRAGVYNNLLMIRGTRGERDSLLQVAAMFDVDWMKGQNAGIFTLANSSPEDVIRELGQVFQMEREGKGLVRFQPIKRMNAILALTQKPAVLREVESWVNRLDRDSVQSEGFYVYRVENGRAKDLANLLTQSFGGGSAVSRAEESEVAPTAAAVQVGSFSAGPASSNGGACGAKGIVAAATTTAHDETGSPSASATIAEGASSAADTSSDGMSTSSAASASGSVRITADERNNTLLIKASAHVYRQMLRVLKKIDRPPLQVLINATLAEVTLNDNLKYGVQFYLQKSKGLDGTLGFTNGNSIEIAPNVPGLNFVVGSLATNPRVILDALSRETAVRVESSPSVVVLHN